MPFPQTLEEPDSEATQIPFDNPSKIWYKKREKTIGGNAMNGEIRREKIKQMLAGASQPMTGTALAAALHVSRQVIVQDIALMRAEQLPIVSTNKGYLLGPDAARSSQPKRVFFVRHTTEQMLEEFMAVIELGGRILDVSVEHDLYGPIRADLLIENAREAADFVERLDRCRDNPLKVLTDDRHYHTVTAPSERLLDLIEQEFRSRGFLE